MNRENLRGKWRKLEGRVRQRWGRFTDADLASIQGDPEALTAKIEQYYGRTHEQAERDVEEWYSLEAAP